MSWFCAQIGAREHYAVPRALHQTGRLTVLYTDFWAGPLVRRLAFGKLRSLATRQHQELQNKAETLKTEILKGEEKPAEESGNWKPENKSRFQFSDLSV